VVLWLCVVRHPLGGRPAARSGEGRRRKLTRTLD
jgi:hypothetical protein